MAAKPGGRAQRSKPDAGTAVGSRQQRQQLQRAGSDAGTALGSRQQRHRSGSDAGTPVAPGSTRDAGTALGGEAASVGPVSAGPADAGGALETRAIHRADGGTSAAAKARPASLIDGDGGISLLGDGGPAWLLGEPAAMAGQASTPPPLLEASAPLKVDGGTLVASDAGLAIAQDAGALTSAAGNAELAIAQDAGALTWAAGDAGLAIAQDAGALALAAADAGPTLAGDGGALFLTAGDGGAPSPLALAADAGAGVATSPPMVTAPEAQLVPSSGDKERVVPQQDFIKGELTMFLGSDRVVTKMNRIGVSAGLDRIGQTYFLLIEPQVDLRFFERKLAIGAGVPLHLEVLSFANGPDGQPLMLKNMGALRKEDYAQPADYAKLLKYVTYGHKEDRLYVNVGQRYASSIGHGAIVRRYAPNIDIDLTRVSAGLDAYGDYGGVELLTNDVMRWNLLGGLAFVKPLAFLDSPIAKSLSIGVSAAADRDAPLSLIYGEDGARQLDADGVHLGATRGTALLYGVDVEVKVVKTAQIDLKPYLDLSMLKGGDSGFTLGVLGRFNAGTSTVHALRGVAELRLLGSRYLPSYFDTFYEVDRYATREVPQDNGISHYDTKYQDVLSGRRPQRVGYYLEGSWGIRGGIGLTLSAEGTTDTAEKNLVAHLEVPAIDFLQFFGSYYKRGFTSFGELGQVDQRSILFAGARLKLLPILFINGRMFKTFRMNPDLQRYDNLSVGSFAGLYDSSFGFTVDLELGYEFE